MVQDGRFLLPLCVVTGLLFFRGITFSFSWLRSVYFFPSNFCSKRWVVLKWPSAWPSESSSDESFCFNVVIMVSFSVVLGL